MKTDIYKEIGERLRKTRQALRYTISSVAKKTGISQSSITKYEKGQDKISLEALMKICKAIDIPYAFLFEEYEERTINEIIFENNEREILKKSGSYDKILLGFTGKSNIFYTKEPFQYFFVRRNMNCSAVIQTLDNSMSPVIKKNSYVGIKDNIVEPFEGQIYLFNLQGIGLVLRRITEIDAKKNKLTITAEDPNIPPKKLILSKVINIDFVKNYDNLIHGILTEIFKNNSDFLIGLAVWTMQEL